MSIRSDLKLSFNLGRTAERGSKLDLQRPQAARPLLLNQFRFTLASLVSGSNTKHGASMNIKRSQCVICFSLH